MLKFHSMKGALFIILALMFITVNASGQKLFFAFGHAEYASPVGQLREKNNGGLGLEAGLGIGLNKTFIVGTIGTTWFFVNRRLNSSDGGVKYTPYKLGVRRYVLLKNLFVKADLGLAAMKIIDTDNKETKLTSSFGAGFKFTTMEVLVDYNSVASYGSWFGIKAGLNLGL